MRISDWSSDVCSSDLAAQTQALPAWDQLTPTQREQLIAPTRERWNAEPAQRAELLERAQRWQQMSPEQRKHAHRGVKRWRHMSDEQRAEARALYARMRSPHEDQRRAPQRPAAGRVGQGGGSQWRLSG